MNASTWSVAGAAVVALASVAGAQQDYNRSGDQGQPREQPREQWQPQQRDQWQERQGQPRDQTMGETWQQRNYLPQLSSTPLAILQKETDDGRTVTLTVENGQIVHADVDGRYIAIERIQMKGNRVRVLNENMSQTLTQIRVPEMGRAAAGAPMRERRPLGATERAYEGQRPVLGVLMTEADRNDLRQARFADRYNEGILLEQVQSGLPADQAGLRPGDIIVRVDGKEPATADVLRETLANKEFGDTVRLTVVRNGQERNVNVRLAQPAPRGRTYYSGEPERGREKPQGKPQPGEEYAPNWYWDNEPSYNPQRDRPR